jgi:hypothetical protein
MRVEHLLTMCSFILAEVGLRVHIASRRNMTPTYLKHYITNSLYRIQKQYHRASEFLNDVSLHRNSRKMHSISFATFSVWGPDYSEF